MGGWTDHMQDLPQAYRMGGVRLGWTRSPVSGTKVSSVGREIEDGLTTDTVCADYSKPTSLPNHQHSFPHPSRQKHLARRTQIYRVGPIFETERDVRFRLVSIQL